MIVEAPLFSTITTTLDILYVLCAGCLLAVICPRLIHCVVFETLGPRVVFQKVGLVESLSCLSLI